MATYVHTGLPQPLALAAFAVPSGALLSSYHSWPYLRSPYLSIRVMSHRYLQSIPLYLCVHIPRIAIATYAPEMDSNKSCQDDREGNTVQDIKTQQSSGPYGRTA